MAKRRRRKLGRATNCANKRVNGRMRKICRNSKGQITSNRAA